MLKILLCKYVILLNILLCKFVLGCLFKSTININVPHVDLFNFKHKMPSVVLDYPMHVTQNEQKNEYLKYILGKNFKCY